MCQNALKSLIVPSAFQNEYFSHQTWTKNVKDSMPSVMSIVMAMSKMNWNGSRCVKIRWGKYLKSSLENNWVCQGVSLGCFWYWSRERS